MSTMECDKRNVLLTNICHKCYTNTNGIYHIADKDWSNDMKTAETINIVCTELRITKADLAKRMGMLPPSLYRKLARESMTLEELKNMELTVAYALGENIDDEPADEEPDDFNHMKMLEGRRVLLVDDNELNREIIG